MSIKDTYYVPHQGPSTSGLSTVGIQNAGYTPLVPGTTYVLAAPVQGCHKYLAITSTSSGAAVTNVYGSTDGAASVTFNNGGTVISFPVSTLDRCVELMGVSSTRWTILNIHPATTVAGSATVGTS